MKVIQEILEAEKKAEGILKNAEKEKAKKIAKAREKALEKITHGKKDVEQQVDNHVRQQMAKLDQLKKKIRDSYAAEAKAIEKKAEKNSDKAAHFVLKAFMEEVK